MTAQKVNGNAVETVLDIAVVGAGIAGLAAAIGLSRAGHNVEVYEKSRFANEVGAAINVCPNAARILSKWGFDFARAKAVVVEQGCVRDGKTLAKAYSSRYDDVVQRFGAHWYFVHRVDLHNELKRLAQLSGPGTKGAKTLLSSEVTAVEHETGTLTLANGTRVIKDLVVAADGVRSCIVREVQGEVAPAVETGQSMFRFLIPSEKIRGLGGAEALFEPFPAGLSIATDAHRRLVWYPCRDGELQNFGAIHFDRRKGIADDEKEDWDAAGSLGDLSELLDEYKDFHPDIVAACRQAEDLKLWRLLYREPNPTWVRGKVALCGDAAHPMLPHQGQGGAQAIEDSAALGVLFTDLASRDSVPERLHMYQEVRRNRAAAMQIFSNAGQEQAHLIQETAKKYVDGPVPANQAEFHQYNFSHDVEAASLKMLEG